MMERLEILAFVIAYAIPLGIIAYYIAGLLNK